MTDFRQFTTPLVNAVAAFALSIALIAGTVSTPQVAAPGLPTSNLEYAA